MKKTALKVTAFLASMSFAVSAYAYEEQGSLPILSNYPTNIVVDGISIESEQKPFYSENQISIPLRLVLENAGFEVKWNNSKRTAEFISPKKDIYSVNIDKKQLINNDNVVFTDNSMQMKNGYTYVSPELLNYIKGLDFDWDMATNAAIITTENPKDNVYLYDLGENKLKNPSRPDTDYQMQGVIGVPDGEKRPIVIILHGSHPISMAKDNRYDIGFSYLVNDLADKGYLTLSMNVAINYSFEDGEPIGCERSVQVVNQQMDLLKRAINGEKGNFPCDLTNKGDLDKVVLIGHSRAGADIFEIAKRLPDIGVDGLVSLAPALVTPLSEGLVDVPAGIIIPQFDGDVVSLDGAKIFDMLENDNLRNSSSELIYLKGGNHGGFSTALVKPDPFADKQTFDKIMKPEKQREFLTSYVNDFLKTLFESGKTPFAQDDNLPDKFAGCDILIQTNSKSDILFSAKQKENSFKTENADAKFVNASSTLENTAGAFNVAGGFVQYDLLNIKWQKENAKIAFESNANLSDKDYLQIDIAQDSSDELNNKQNQDMIITLTDKNGKSSEVKLAQNTPALSWQEGEVKRIELGQDDYFLQYSTFTPIVSIKLDLSNFKDIDLSNISKITLGFPKSSGSVMLREIRTL